ncbi:MAG: hypothetical protein A3J74_09315 [Elusimicrobia bacterium RIFCSPHIGHO2_02_FULL_57_9]|nr:MAG: hypothetical protein A3J74_09315 [Elusimicrobia bacterium RIFCSPHIGHO2_02_FULL_57_9]
MYEIKALPSASRDLEALEKAAFDRIKTRILGLRQEPRPIGIIKLTAEEGYRLRAGDYRILYRIDDKAKIVYLYRIKHRREAYR